MRLLNVYTLEFAEFEGDSLPPYKITSHRWTSDEVILKDVTKKRNVESKGYRKIEGFCQFIREDNNRLRKHVTNDLSACEWVWIDTACIDKKSSAELQESINSMFRWYSRALECIAYIADVPSLSAGSDVVMSEFRQSEWFTRGWTLQELLVPGFVVFLNREWEAIGHKCAYCGYKNPCKDAGPLLNNVLAEITGIAEDIMFDYRKSTSLTVDEKMSWMANRTTTKTEDMAYCMMGIFDVNMPLLYGEGVKAMQRLEREITSQIYHDPSTSTATTTLKSRMGKTDQKTKERMEDVSKWNIRPATDIMEQPLYSCESTWCASRGVAFKRKADLDRHRSVVHGRRTELYDCEVLGCHRVGDYGFTRKDKMVEHMREVHRSLIKIPASQPRDPGAGR
jgi:hypothetical protein